MNARTVSDLGERALIARITSRLAMPRWVVVGPGDDGAVVEPARGCLEVLTTDVQVEGVHFDRRFVPPDAIGHRALAVNLSDLAAMGARPRAALLSLVLPDGLEIVTVDGLVDGLLRLAATHGIAVVGGNIARSPGPIMIDVLATGLVKRRRALTRAGASPGDEVYVTGTMGDAAAGLAALRRLEPSETKLDNPCTARYLRPQPRVRAGGIMSRARVATACIDLSDGLAAGLRQVVEASGVGMEIDAASIPVRDEVRRWHEADSANVIDAVLLGGDDYELLFTARPSHRGRLRQLRRSVGDLPITRIGVVTKARALVVRSANGGRDVPLGHQHFA